MKRAVCHILILVCVLSGCSRKGKVIPRGDMIDIYAEMLLADQWLKDHPEYRAQADTSLFYDPIFKRYGYSFKDYDASVQHYLLDPERYAKMLQQSSKKLLAKKNKFERIRKRRDEVKGLNARVRGYRHKDFEADTLLWHKPDTSFLDSLRLDSLLRDSLRLDSLRLDSLRVDSLRLDSLRRDSLENALLSLKKTKFLKKNNLN